MRILLVNTFYYPEVKGGAEYSVKKLAEALVQNGNEVIVISAGKSDTVETIDSVNVHRIKFKSVYHSYGDVKKTPIKKAIHRSLDFYNPFNEKILEQIIDEFAPDIVHTNNLYEITPAIWKVAKTKNIPVIHTIRDYYLMCPRTTLLTKNNEKCINPNGLCKIYRKINRNLTKYVDCVTAPSKMMIDNVDQLGFFKNSSKRVIYNAIDFNMDDVKNEIELRRKKDNEIVTFVYLGGLHTHKGISFLLEAFSKLKNNNAHLIFAGKGIEEERVKDACRKDKRIEYVGFLNEKDVLNLMKKCDVLICPSLWEEPFGRVILDSYKNGMPVIASEIGALPEIVVDGKTGVLVRPDNVNELTNAMGRFFDSKDSINQSYKYILPQLEKFHLLKQVESFQKLYKEYKKGKE